MPCVYTKVFEGLSLQPCVASVNEDFFSFFLFFVMTTEMIGAERPSGCRDQNKQEDVRRCLPSRKPLTAHIPDPRLIIQPHIFN